MKVTSAMGIETSRPGEFGSVMAWFDAPAAAGRVDIFGLSGFGGIGKSFLLRNVIEQVRPETRGYLRITIDGADSKLLGQFMPIYERQFAPRALSPGRSNMDYFPRVRKLASRYTNLERSVENRLEQASASQEVKALGSWLLRTGALMNRAIPMSKDVLDVEAVRRMGAEEHLNSAIDLVSELTEPVHHRWIPGPVKDLVGISYESRIRTDLYGLAADEWTGDLSALLTGYREEDRLRITHAPVPGLQRLLLVVDDFEILGKSIADFLTEALIPKLGTCDFHSTIIILGRDDLFDAHIAFQHHHSHLIRERIRLGLLPEDIARGMFRAAGYREEQLGTLIAESMGYPFLVSLLCEAKGGSVSFYDQFYKRTTRWLGETERGWVLPLCYLDKVTHSSIAAMLPDAPAAAVFDWFSQEASLRDPSAKWYVVAPYIRRTLLEYNERRIGTGRHAALLEVGARASAAA